MGERENMLTGRLALLVLVAALLGSDLKPPDEEEQ